MHNALNVFKTLTAIKQERTCFVISIGTKHVSSKKGSLVHHTKRDNMESIKTNFELSYQRGSYQ